MQHRSRAITAVLPKAPFRKTSRHPRRVADAIVDVLVDMGVEAIFALPGGTIAPVLDACLDRPEIEVVTTRHESGALFAAAGYARATGKPAVICVTSGPGVLNAITGLASAHCEGIPLLLLAGEVPRGVQGRHALQDGSAHHLDVLGMVRPVTKLALELTRGDAAPAIVRRALRTASSGKQGPVVLTVPMDISPGPSLPHTVSSEVTLDYRLDHPPMLDAISEAASRLAGAERPVLFAGSGIRYGEGPARLRHLAERLQAPVITTPKAKGLFPESHPLSLGVFGHGGHPSAREHLEGGLDVLLAVGTSMSDTGTDGWSDLLRPSDALIHVDVDALQVGRHYPVTQALIGEADRILEELAARVPQYPHARRFGVRYHSVAEKDPVGAEGKVTPQRALWELQKRLPADTYYACDIGEHLLFATHYLRIDPPGAFMAMNGLASMGSGLGAAIGVKLAYPHRPVVAICGDGVFAMHGSEVATATAAGLPVIFVVLNDQRFGMVELGNDVVFGRSPSYSTNPMSIPALAEAMGAESIVIRKPSQILSLDLTSRLRPLVLDVRIDRTARMPKNGRFEELKRTAEARA